MILGIMIAILGAFSVVGGPVASADTKCQKTNPRTGVCVIVAPHPGRGSDSGDRGDGGSSGHASRCILGGEELPCRHRGGTWSNSHHCYLRRMLYQPPKSAPAWQGHTTGRLYHCFVLDDLDSYPVWLATPPGAAPLPDPRVLALQAIKSMRLTAIRIGIVPESRAGSVGVIGLPTWMWVANPDQHTWGPIARTAASRGFTVTATAKVQRVVWSMGDGSTVTCIGPGSPYADAYGKRPSPDCGHTYTRQGTYTVRATSYWIVTWSGIGQTGTIPLNFTRTSVIMMGEAQVLTR